MSASARPIAAAPTESFLATLFNGPWSVGIAASDDAFPSAKYGPGIITGKDFKTKHLCAGAFGHPSVFPGEGFHQVIAIVAEIFAAKPFLRTEGLGSRTSENFFVYENDKAYEESAAAWADAVKQANPGHLSDAITIVFAMKFTWYQMNHHVGSSGPAGFFQKVFERMAEKYKFGRLSREAEEKVVHVLWTLGHWFDTRVILHAMGFKEIRISAAIAAEATALFGDKIKDDIRKRLTAFPAGTAKIGDCATALRVVGSSTLRNFIAIPGDASNILENAASVLKNPVRHHMGSMYLTGSPRIVLPDPEDSTIEMLGVFLAVTRPNSTLKGAACFMNIKDSTNAELASSIRSVVRAQNEALQKAARDTSVRKYAAGWAALQRGESVEEAMLAAEEAEQAAAAARRLEAK